MARKEENKKRFAKCFAKRFAKRFAKCYLFQTFRKFTLLLLFYRFYFVSQPLDNFFLTVKTIFNWDLHSIATSTVLLFVATYLRKQCSDLSEVVLGNNDGKDDDDDSDANNKDAEVVEIGTDKALTMLHRLVNLKYLSKEERNFLAAMKEKLEKIRVLNKKRSHIKDYFMLE